MQPRTCSRLVFEDSETTSAATHIQWLNLSEGARSAPFDNCWMCVALEDEAEPSKNKREHVRGCIMATSEVDLKWIWYNVIIASDDGDNNIKDMKSWNTSGNV